MTDDETGGAGDARRGPGLERSPAVDQLSEAVIVADADGSITFFNDAALRLHGDGLDRGGPEAHADGFRLLTMDGQPFGPAEFPLARALSGETVRDVRWRVRRPDDSEIVAIGSASPLVDSEGRRIGAVLTARDQTERTMAEEALRESEARARADAGSSWRSRRAPSSAPGSGTCRATGSPWTSSSPTPSAWIRPWGARA